MAGGDKGRMLMVTMPSIHRLVDKKLLPQKLHPSHSHSLSVQRKVSQPDDQDSFGLMGDTDSKEKVQEKDYVTV